MARENWTDERLDDLKENVNRRFDQIDGRFERVESQISAGFARVDDDIKELRQTLIQGFFVLVGIQATTILAMVGLKFL